MTLLALLAIGVTAEVIRECGGLQRGEARELRRERGAERLVRS